MGNTDNMDFESCNFETKFKISVWVSEKNINFIIRKTWVLVHAPKEARIIF